MKKITLSFVAIAMCLMTSISVSAQRAWAYDLKLTVDGENNTFTYKAVSDATATLIFSNEDGTEVGTVDLGAVVAGENTKTLTASEIPAGTNLRWAIKMTGEAIDSIVEVTDQTRGIYDFYNTQGVVVDNNPESSDFGKIYVEATIHGASDGSTERAKAQKAGIFIYNQELDELNPTSNVGILPVLPDTYPLGKSNTMQRLVIDPTTGNLVFAYNKAGVPAAVWSIDRANLSDSATNLVAGISELTRINSICFDEEGALYVMDDATAYAHNGTIYKIKDGVATKIIDDSKWGNSYNTLASDGRGGLWVAQNRSKLDGFYQLVHVTKDGVLDYTVYDGDSHGFVGSSTRGAMAYDAKRQILAQGRDGVVKLYNVEYDEVTAVPTLTLLDTTLYVGNNIDGIAFDYAGDLYIVNSSKEKFQKFVVPTNDNVCIVPAATKYLVNKTSTAIDDVMISVKVQKVIRNGQVLIIRDGKTYNMMGQEIR